MAWIKVIDEKQADGYVKAVYSEAIRRLGFVPNIVSIHSLSPQSLRAFSEFSKLLFSPRSLSRAQKDMIGIVVSAINRCHY